MRVIVIGATGLIGGAVASAFERKGHEVLRAARHADVQVDISSQDSIRSMYRTVGTVDGVICCAGEGAFGKLSELTDEQFEFTLQSKLMGQVNLVRNGVNHVTDRGVFLLTSGVFSQRPIPGVSALATANGAIESFTLGAALDLPNNQRIGTIAPPFITETAIKMGASTEGTLGADENARYYLEFAEGTETGTVTFPGQ